MLKPFQLYYNLQIGFQDLGCHIDNHIWLLSVGAMQCNAKEGLLHTKKLQVFAMVGLK